MREAILPKRQPQHTQAHPLGGEATHLCHMRGKIQTTWRHEETRNDAAQQVVLASRPTLWVGISERSQAETTPAWTTPG